MAIKNIDSQLEKLIEMMINKNASDLILTEGKEPMLRIVGDLLPASEELLGSDDVRRMAYSLLSDKQVEEFTKKLEMDTSFGMPGQARFRVNVFQQRNSVGCVIRMLPYDIPTIESLGVPLLVKKWAKSPHGIIITTGPTGSGKSTSQAAMIGYLNQEIKGHVITIEDPIEFTHQHGSCVIDQREVGTDTLSFPEALKHAFRQNPNVIMIGEMRDRETFESALQLAETGHLVLATLHTPDAPQTVERIIDVFPPHQQQQVRQQLAFCLQGVVSQRLLPSAMGKGRVLATEIMIATPAIRNMIRERAVEQMLTAIQTGAQFGMQTMDKSLKILFETGQITIEDAMNNAKNIEELKYFLKNNSK